MTRAEVNKSVIKAALWRLALVMALAGVSYATSFFESLGVAESAKEDTVSLANRNAEAHEDLRTVVMGLVEDVRDCKSAIPEIDSDLDDIDQDLKNSLAMIEALKWFHNERSVARRYESEYEEVKTTREEEKPVGPPSITRESASHKAVQMVQKKAKARGIDMKPGELPTMEGY